MTASGTLERNVEPDAIKQYISEAFAGLDVVEASNDSFYFYDPERAFDPSRRQPFATIVTDDRYDDFSHLNRPGVFRLNMGVSRETFRTLFGAEMASAGEGGPGENDFTALDQLMPHPVYGRMFWICILSPSAAMFETVKPLLAEAYELSRKRSTRANPKSQRGAVS
jgi:hypothetical protein